MHPGGKGVPHGVGLRGVARLRCGPGFEKKGLQVHTQSGGMGPRRQMFVK